MLLSRTTRSDEANGSGRRRTALVALNTAAVAAMPSAIVVTMANEASGLRRLRRMAYCTSASTSFQRSRGPVGSALRIGRHRRFTIGAIERNASRQYHARAADR